MRLLVLHLSYANEWSKLQKKGYHVHKVFVINFPNNRSLKDKLLACVGSARFKSRMIDNNTEI
jgi:hypothetical protein